MPPSPHNPIYSADALKKYLAQALPGSRLSLSQADNNLQPLILLETNHLLAGFGLSNGDPKGNYETLYHDFKRQLKSSETSWQHLDVAFVFCVEPNISELEKLSSNIETDVFFCRKFVVPISGSIESSFSRLPFLPLAKLEGRTLRPPSAQSYLIQIGIPPVLAKYIVVQGARGVEGIVEDCVGGEFGKPVEPSLSNISVAGEIEQVGEAVHLETLEIDNFRAYRKPQTFRLGKKVTVLYGPNGFGKTSFFDAVDFVATGGIGRLPTSDAQFSKIARHLDNQSEDGEVSITFSRGGRTRRVTRQIENRKEATLDRHSTDRKAILAELTGREILPTDRVDNFIDLFRATHLFNQEAPELAKGFRDECALDPDIVSRMLAFQDYANALAKVQRVEALLKDIVEKAEAESKDFTRQIADDRTELQKLAATSQGTSDSQSLMPQYEALRLKLTDLGIPIGSQSLSVETLRSWRGLLEGKQADCTRKSDAYSQALREVSQLPKLRVELAGKEEQLSTKEAELKTAETKLAAAEEAQRFNERQLTEVSTSLASAQAKTAALQWHRANRPLYIELIAREKQLIDEIGVASLNVQTQRNVEEKAASDVRSQESKEKILRAELDRKQNRVKSIQLLQSKYSKWQSDVTLSKSISEELTKLNQALAGFQKLEMDNLPKLAVEKSKEDELTRQISESERSQSELKRLLSQLQSHVTDGTCPVCGDDHGTKAQLLGKIGSRIQSDTATLARQSLLSAKQSINELTTAISEAKQKREATNQQIALLTSQKAAVDKDNEQFLREVESLGTTSEDKKPVISEVLSSGLLSAENDVATLPQAEKKEVEALEIVRVTLANARELLSKYTNEEAAKKTALIRLRTELDALKGDQRWKESPLDLEPEQLGTEDSANLNQIENFRTVFSTLQNKIPSHIEEAAKCRQASGSLKDLVQSFRSQISALQNRINQILTKLDQAGLSRTTTESILLESIAGETRAQSQYAALRDTTANLEIALDAATTSAALMSLQQGLRNKEKVLESANARRELHEPWREFFSRVSRLLANKQSDAIEDFTKEYGPRTSVIQRRLRPVYGFEDIQIHSRDSSIHVRVTRNGLELRPIDYFSQSQQQTLLLGIFLTACISQTWSGFAPIFMDDPVTHFDDLNTYSFLDLIVGLLESDSASRQFIISTCDEKLLQLARQKFRHFGKDGVYYRFDAIGKNGPVIKEIANA